MTTYPLPDFSNAFEYENQFYLSCNVNRLGKVLAQYELFKLACDLPGEIVECGVFKGASFVRLAMMRDLLLNGRSKKLIGFDVFGAFPETAFEKDQPVVEKWTREAGQVGISQRDLIESLTNKNLDYQVELVPGNILETVPEYVRSHPELKLSLLNLDTDVYEPAVVILEKLWPRLVRGGVLLMDDYGVFPGETKAVDEFFADQAITIKRLSLNKTPSYVIKP